MLGMRNDTKGFAPIDLVVGIVLALAVFSLIFGFASTITIEDEDEWREPPGFALATTETDVAVDDEDGKKITPMYEAYRDADISWTSSDESIATVSQDGTVKGVSEGTATVTARYGGDDYPCTVNVKGSVTNELKVYNSKSDDYDYALLSGEYFEDGVMTLSFNSLGRAVVSLSSYSQELFDKAQALGNQPTVTGNFLTDCSKIVITVTDPSGNVKNVQYNGEGGQFPGFDPWLMIGASGTSYDKVQCNCGKLAEYGTYTVKMTLTYTVQKGYGFITYPDSKQITLDGSFTYKQGDGKIDSTNEFTRSFAWLDQNGNPQSFQVQFPYYEYLQYSAENTTYMVDLKMDDSRYLVNYDMQDDSVVTTLCTDGGLTAAVEEKLEKLYTDKYGAIDTAKPDFAQFILTYVQVCYSYAYDHVQYLNAYGPYADMTDYWAFPSETVWSGNGDCEDTSILAATLFKLAGYESGVYLVPGHAIAAVHLDGYDTENLIGSTNLDPRSYGIMVKDGYYGCETTAEDSRPIGVINSRVTIGTEVYDYTDTTQPWCKLYKLNDE